MSEANKEAPKFRVRSVLTYIAPLLVVTLLLCSQLINGAAVPVAQSDTSGEQEPRYQNKPPAGLSLDQREQEILMKIQRKSKEPELPQGDELDNTIEGPADTPPNEPGMSRQQEDSLQQKSDASANNARMKPPIEETNFEDQLPDDEQGEVQVPQSNKQKKNARPPKSQQIENVDEEVDTSTQSPPQSIESEISLTRENLKLQRELTGAYAKISELTSKLDEVRRQLTLAETQVEQLSKAAERSSTHRPTDTETGYRPPSGSNGTTGSTEYEQWGSSTRAEIPQRIQSSTSTPLVTIAEDGVPLRTGPGLSNSVIMMLRRGDRVAVETRSGDWLRIIAPTGARAWIPVKSVQFARPQTREPQTVRRPFQEPNNTLDTEERALELLRRDQ